jgi:3-carboxy-cis,cis-muconate cycloisomerase
MLDPAAMMFASPELSRLFSPPLAVQRMLDVEAALARAEAAAGIIPREAARAIGAQCQAVFYDVDTLYRDAIGAASPAVPLVRMLTARVGGGAARFVHWGATSQDIIDTAMVLQIRDALGLLGVRLLQIGGTCASLAERYRRTPMAGRTLLQQAVPITFGLKAARWLGLVTRSAARLTAVRPSILVVQFGGAAGTLASLGPQGLRVMELLAAELRLGVPALPWHAERDRIAALGAALGIVAGAMGKIATDLALLSQTEVGEVVPAPGRGGRSSAMPHKRNPADATAALAACRLALAAMPVVFFGMLQEHERAAGGWQAEWRAVPDLFRFAGGSADAVARALGGLVADERRMAANLTLGGGQIMAEALTMALADRVGRDAAYRLVEAACERAAGAGAELRDAAEADEQIRAALPDDAIARALDPVRYVGSAGAFIDRALAEFHAARVAEAGGREP